MALQKLLYFSHGQFFSRYRQPLVKGPFEAWENGPVHPQIYHAFKTWGRRPITALAVRVDPITGEVSDPEQPVDEDAIDVVERVVGELGRLTPGQLVTLSHAKDAPWHRVKSAYQRGEEGGVRISNELIGKYFAYHKLSSTTLQGGNEVAEDTPLKRYGFRADHGSF